uniref:Gag-pol polyprotein n=1 Tax=Rhabditophanes sp. KR3021 TaxID=114890 RepID=A0AC35THB3_9BILA
MDCANIWLALVATNDVVKYDQIAAAYYLNNDDEVEAKFLGDVQNGLINGRINQRERTVRITDWKNDNMHEKVDYRELGKNISILQEGFMAALTGINDIQNGYSNMDRQMSQEGGYQSFTRPTAAVHSASESSKAKTVYRKIDDAQTALNEPMEYECTEEQPKSSRQPVRNETSNSDQVYVMEDPAPSNLPTNKK